MAKGIKRRKPERYLYMIDDYPTNVEKVTISKSEIESIVSNMKDAVFDSIPIVEIYWNAIAEFKGSDDEEEIFIQIIRQLEALDAELFNRLIPACIDAITNYILLIEAYDSKKLDFKADKELCETVLDLEYINPDMPLGGEEDSSELVKDMSLKDYIYVMQAILGYKQLSTSKY